MSGIRSSTNQMQMKHTRNRIHEDLAQGRPHFGHLHRSRRKLGQLLSARQHLDQPIKVFLALVERLHQHALVLAVDADIINIGGKA
jgi:hypothetical protein